MQAMDCSFLLATSWTRRQLLKQTGNSPARRRSATSGAIGAIRGRLAVDVEPEPMASGLGHLTSSFMVRPYGTEAVREAE
jgi:hypothetical protein